LIRKVLIAFLAIVTLGLVNIGPTTPATPAPAAADPCMEDTTGEECPPPPDCETDPTLPECQPAPATFTEEEWVAQDPNNNVVEDITCDAETVCTTTHSDGALGAPPPPVPLG
jgi:hypothetical protein